ncbi:zinc-binding alcohol dehydrogenase [Chloroflexi bacterium TSY]|nr:zinc-binding alcohol dehydrogenase [Chloroflexi bacterium TSY]
MKQRKSRTGVYFEAPGQIAIRQDAIPKLESHQVLVWTLLSAISPGTEMLFYRGQVPQELRIDATIPGLMDQVSYPLKYGYAAVGHVIDVGGSDLDSWIGRLVFAFNPHESHFVTEPSQLLLVPDGLLPEQAAFLPNMESAINFVMDGRPLVGERVAVFGQGIVGLLTTFILGHYPLGRFVVIDEFERRRELGSAFGAMDAMTSTAALHRLSDFDLVYELSGNPTALDQAIAVTGYSGRVVIGSWYGQKQAQLNLGGDFHRSRIRLMSSQVSTIDPTVSGRWDKVRRLDLAWQMLQELDCSQLITHRYPIAQAADAYVLIDQQPEELVQVLLIYQD